MRLSRSTLIGAGVGLALGMPLFEVFLLAVLAIDGELFGAAYTIRYFTSSFNLIALLIILHAVTALIGGLVGALLHQARNRQRARELSHENGK